jgi:predicted transcriptional regulator
MSDTTLNMTAKIVSVFVGNNAVRADQLPFLIREVHRTLATVGEAPSKAEPVVEVKKSVFGDHLVCLTCGGSFKTLKRHLGSEHETTPDEYRSRYGLPRGYPMVSPNYAKVRSAMAKKIGLGLGGRGRPRKTAGRKRG